MVPGLGFIVRDAQGSRALAIRVLGEGFRVCWQCFGA